ncbi:TetR/AcrR family transcriptional regulator [Nocardia farcinica]|uniref:Bacterial regulatory proteins, tetR family n=2 Tax=Nocardia farcinica TaxID=37329 RepID=A0A0H5NLJ4_NOCFR|nr:MULTISPECIES: TetR/AcrR family transcriptional regulator [Nocardia]AXK85043.1 TetR/AcrR family transcriptional regulator [Nocardia farcinica]MBF6140889.1 TetR/AcrR family transcriptional regulator [Nocardia farcinica]MBF6184527.1 TetR/AcrR family transcriptional regulator [Nocardia farcinica]MBF6249821.1 TetR/AcrR family transcriptional regulator [Nocardia farcinica]MBF6261141.1 TetR/AcrR family transcriptional regulator [Nocardia farcinica]
MTGRRGRVPAVAAADIRRAARALLVAQGPEAMTLRAIARDLGVTAPALYRHYASHEELADALRADICLDLADELAVEAAAATEDGLLQLIAICRGFRRWALAHAHEFTLVFASPNRVHTAGLRRFEEPFGRVFLAAAGRLLTTYELALPPTDTIPPALRADLIGYQNDLLAMLAEAGQKFPAEKLDLGVTYLMITLWARLYGHVTLEVFGNYPLPVRDPEALFDTVLAELARGIGV